jgi:hypothetical protein
MINNFIRDLPEKIQLLPRNYLQQVVLFDDKVCNTLHFNFGMESLDSSNLIISKDRTVCSAGKKWPFLLGYNTEFDKTYVNLILNHFGSLVVLYLFNHVYQRFPSLAIQAIKQSYTFNNFFCGIGLLQALNRLAYAYYGLDYETYRNHENIKTRSVIEDFHSHLWEYTSIARYDY